MAETQTLTRAEKVAAMRAAGMSDEQSEGIVGAEQVAETAVRANEGDDLKYGVSSILKVYSNGTARTRMGLRTPEAHVALIEQLQARYADLDGSVEFTPFALVAQDADESE
jgi:hypothetical protein